MHDVFALGVFRNVNYIVFWMALYGGNGFSGCLCCIKGSLKTVLTSIRADEQAALFYRRENHH